MTSLPTSFVEDMERANGNSSRGPENLRKARAAKRPPAPPEVRFFRRVRKTEGCWYWEGYRGPKGYGQFPIAKRNIVQAHRYSYELVNGPIAEGMCLLHSCDNAPCVNPSHLFPGTRADNNQDMMAKGRHVAWNAAKSVCLRGHALPLAGRNGKRPCRACQNIGQNARRAAMRAAGIRRKA